MKKASKLVGEGAAELRRQAESQLRLRPGKGASPASAADSTGLLHELQVHQIELELQNEELQQAKAEVDMSLEKYTDLYDFAPVGYFSIDEEGLILDVNLTGAALLGTERALLHKRRFPLFVTPQDRAAFASFLTSIFAGHKKQVCEISLMKAGRPAFSADLQAMSAYAVKGVRKWCRVAVIDVSARKRAEEAQRRVDDLAATNRHLEAEIVRRHAVEAALKESERRALQSLAEARELQERLRQMARQILVVEENQRKQISRELHDKICQLLVGISVHMTIFTKTAVRNPNDLARTIVPLRRLVTKGVRIVHRFARDLRPSALDDLGLIPALRTYIGDFPKRKGRQIRFAAYAGVEALDSDKRTALYRVTQEALVNAAKHAGASVIKVSILKAEGGVCLEIADNGKGFDQKRLEASRGKHRLGLIGMRERVEMVGGRFNATSEPGAGVLIQAFIPLKKSKAGPATTRSRPR